MTKTQMFLAAIISGVVALAINTFIVQACWNYFAPAVFSGVPEITFLQAMVLAIGVRSLAGANNVKFNKEKS